MKKHPSRCYSKNRTVPGHFIFRISRGDIHSLKGGSVSQSIVLRYKEIEDILCTNHQGKVMFLSKYSFGTNNIIFSMLRTQYTLYFFVAEHYGLRNTTYQLVV
jgi:hypothetical protein